MPVVIYVFLNYNLFMEIPRKFNRFFKVSLILFACIYAIGMHLSLMDVDASQYALISKQMFHSHSFLQVMERGHDYLDKPPLLFWTACCSFEIFGVADWSYRLPSVLCLALGIYSTYRFTKLYYDELSARLAALVMTATCASYLMTHDVRTDTMLTGWVMFSIWQLAEFDRSLQFKRLVWGAIGIGLAMLTKGPIGLIIPVTAFSCQFIYHRQWKSFFRWQYLVALVIIALILLPMSYGLYEQYDVKNKTQYGIHHVSGLRFYYWTQSFGRITGESTWSNDPDPFFLLHSFAWSFLPWTALFLPALFAEIKDKIKTIRKPVQNEVISLGGFVLILLFLMRSRYQLPHYSFPIHPLAAVITGVFLARNINQPTRLFNFFSGLQLFVLTCLFVGQFLLLFFVFNTNWPVAVIASAALVLFIALLFKRSINWPGRVIMATVVAFVSATMVLNIQFYPNLLDYQTSSAVAKDVNEMAGEDSKLLIYNNYASNCTEFYSKVPVIEYSNDNNLQGNLVKGRTYILADTVDCKRITDKYPDIKPIKMYRNFAVTGLSLPFLNPKTRNSVTDKLILLKY